MAIDKLSAAALSRSHMPANFDISLDSYFGRSDIGRGHVENEARISQDFGATQSMQGFEKTYKNIIDYIVRITFRIWEDRDVDYIADTYSSASMVYDDYGLQLGNEKIIADTRHTTNAFSDIELVADEVIWAGDDEIGYHTSHRTIIRGTNDGDSKYGPATGKTVDVLVIANCVVLKNEIFLEHVLYNNSSLIQQLGLDITKLARSMSGGDGDSVSGWPRDAQTWQALRVGAKPEVALSIAEPIEGFDPDAFARAHLNQVWNRGDLTCLPKYYTNDFAFTGPTDRQSLGIDAYATFVLSIRECFSDLQVEMDEVYWMGNETTGFLISERWSATATHTQDGLFGSPSGVKVQLWGITQQHIVHGKVIREWLLFNELDLMMQIARAHQNKSQIRNL